MSKLLAGVAVTAMFVMLACSGGGAVPTMPGLRLDGGLGIPDGFFRTEDLAGTERDMAFSNKLGCNGYAQCLIDETNNGSTLTVAQATCGGKSKTTAPTAWTNALACGQQHCLTASKCVNNGTMLTNTNGTPANVGTPCGDCLNNATAAILKTVCPQTTSLDCNPSECQTATSACLNDLP